MPTALYKNISMKTNAATRIVIISFLILLAGCPAAHKSGSSGQTQGRTPASSNTHYPETQTTATENTVRPIELPVDVQLPQYAVVDVYYATDRKTKETDASQITYTNKRGTLSYGTAKVSIPHDHKIGHLESPSLMKFEFREHPEKHVVLMAVEQLNESSFYELISSKLKESKSSKAFVFIHGYNVTFENAARRTAQIAYDIQFNGVPVFYSWPSQGKETAYTIDENNIEWTQTNIETFLETFASESRADEIFLIAHSMGNRALTKAYISLAMRRPVLMEKFTEIILAAPDIDAEIFVRDIAPAMQEAGNPVTLYASSKDLALKASKKVHGAKRLGDSSGEVVMHPCMESIDASSVDTGFLGHSYYGDETSILADMYYLINQKLRAANRDCLHKVDGKGGIYWAFGD